jgi:lipoprotein-anchoring transpeptidase ErfK/SrfK
MMVPLFAQASVAEKEGQDNGSPALTYRLKTISVVRTSPNGRIVDVWDSSTLFTSNVAEGDWIRVTGTFPDGEWQPASQPLWINRYYARSFTPKYKPTPAKTHPGVVRYVEIDKSTFELKVIEKRNKQKDVIFKTEVALGMDRCLPKSKGGRCYFTEPGEYKVRWKIHDPKGIEWCIPKSMEKEYANAIARGERCYRGAIGRHALNIGKSYAIHGTSNPASLGKRVSHGCIRTVNSAVQKLYSLMDVGDKVYIVE